MGAAWHDEEDATRPVSPTIQGVLDYIAVNFSEPLCLADLAEICGLSLHRFVTVFRRQIGIPPHQYICRTRIRAARTLLQQGVPAAIVALDTGFCDQSHLSRHFKRQCGTTPGHFAAAFPRNPARHEAPSCA